MGDFAPNAAGLLAPLHPWLEDKNVSEILINRPGFIYVEKNAHMREFEVSILDIGTISRLFQLIANENGQQISPIKPLLSGNLQDGSRVQLVLPPIAHFPTLAIRRKVVQCFELTDYDRLRFYEITQPFEMHSSGLSQLEKNEQILIQLYQKRAWSEFIRCAIEFKKNIVISGGTSSGKTTFLAACLRHIPINERIILLEDAREIDIPHPNKVCLLASKGEQGLAEVTMQDLLQCCLRLRPDRIIVGEIRGKEVLDFLGACSTGHQGSFTSIHANNPRVALMRMKQLYKQNPVSAMNDEDILKEIQEVVDIIIQLAKTPQGHRVKSIYYKYANLD